MHFDMCFHTQSERETPQRCPVRRYTFRVQSYSVREKPMRNEGASDTNPIHIRIRSHWQHKIVTTLERERRFRRQPKQDPGGDLAPRVCPPETPLLET